MESLVSRMAVRVVNLQRPRLLLHHVPELERTDASPDHRQIGRGRQLLHVNGTRQRFSAFSHLRQCGDEVLRMFVTGGRACARRRWHAPAHQCHLGPGLRVADHRCWVVREDAKIDADEAMWLGVAEAADRCREILVRRRTGRGAWYAIVQILRWDATRRTPEAVASFMSGVAGVLPVWSKNADKAPKAKPVVAAAG
jgi:hypothetical protein